MYRARRSARWHHPSTDASVSTDVEVAVLETQVAELERENAELRAKVQELELTIEYQTRNTNPFAATLRLHP